MCYTTFFSPFADDPAHSADSTGVHNFLEGNTRWGLDRVILTRAGLADTMRDISFSSSRVES